tara:strand:+ start:655 stop:900 length:246 start_codon:yes stop_codon:yes gene_type:complete
MLDKRIRKWLFSLIVKPTIRFLLILNDLKTFVALTVTTAVTFILLMKRICITTLVMFGEHLLKVIAKLNIEGIKTNENMAS